jgi:hypothetical protein
MTWYPNGTTAISDDRGQEFVMHIPIDKANFTLLSNENTVVQRLAGEDFQYDVYWVPFENEDRIVDKYKFTIIGSSKEGIDVKFAVDTDNEIVSDGNKFIVTEKIKNDSVNSTSSILSNVTSLANSTALLDTLSNGTSGASTEGLGLDWSDAKAAGFDMKFDPESLELSVEVGKEFSVDPTTVSTISTSVSPSSGDYYEGEKRIVKVGSTIFVFFYDGNNIVYKTSTDNGNSFSAATTSAATGMIGSDLNRWTIASTTFDGSPRISLLYFKISGGNTDFFAKRGTVSGASITWNTATLLFSVSNLDSAGARGAAVASTDSSGNVYAALRWVPDTGTYHYRIMNSSDGGFTWNTSLNAVDTGDATRITMALTDLESEMMLFAYATFSGADFSYRVLNATWGSLQNTTDAGFTDSFTKKLSSDSNSIHSAYLAYVTSGPGALKVAIWNSTGGFQGFETANGTASHSLPSITITPDDLVRVYTVSDSKIANTTKAGSTWQGTEFSFGTSFDSPDQLTSAILHPSALWVESGNDLRFGTAPIQLDGDLQPTELLPVQAIFNHDSLVDGKLTLLRVNITNTSTLDLVTQVRLEYETLVGTIETNVTEFEEVPVNAGETKTVFLPSDGFITPKRGTSILPDPNDYKASIEVDSDNRFSETNEANNQISAGMAVKDTGHYRILYKPFRLQGEEAPTCASGDMQVFANNTSDYVKAVYPIGETDFSQEISCIDYVAYFDPQFDTSQLNGGTLAYLGLQLAQLAWFGNADVTIGVVRPLWFSDHTGGNRAGVATPGVGGVIVERLYLAGTTPAHELAHTLFWVTYGHAKATSFFSGHMVEELSPGYWVQNRCEMGHYETGVNDCVPPSEVIEQNSPVDFMVANTGSLSTVDRWISNFTFDHLQFMLKADILDPPVIGMSGIIFDNGTSFLNPWYRLNSTEDAFLNDTGVYTVIYENSLGQSIGETGFDADSHGNDDTGPLGGAPFALRIPDLVSTHKIVIKKENQTVAERIISPNAPEMNITSPNGGEVFVHGENVTVSWNSSDLDGDELRHTVSMSHDAGESWTPLALNVNGTQFNFTVPADIVSDEVLFRVYATDGINTGEDVSDATSTFSGPSSVDMYLHATGPIANPTNLFLNSSAPSTTTAKYRDSASIKFSGGNQWKAIGEWPTSSPPSAATLSDLGNLTVWLGLKNSDDLGTRFDLRAEVYRDDELVASGLTHCISGVVRNAANAKEVMVSFDAFPPEEFDGTDNLSVKILTRIGTNPDDTFCGGHSNATGLRLYFDSISRPSMFNATFT